VESKLLEYEIWKNIKDFPNKQISNFGKIKKIYKTGKEKLYKTRISSNTYQITFNNKFVHRLVAQTFIPNPLNLPEVNHIDGNKLNNCVDNLEWCTRSNNVKHAYNTGLNKGPQGVKSGNCKLSEKDIIDIRNLHKNNKLTYLAISKLYCVNKGQIGKIIRREKWKHI